MRAYATARIFIFLAETVLGLPFETRFMVASGLGVFANLALVEYLLARTNDARADLLKPPG